MVTVANIIQILEGYYSEFSYKTEYRLIQKVCVAASSSEETLFVSKHQ